MNEKEIINNPKISVIMSVYNTEEEYLLEAIQSILNQTFKEFEFVIIDDASDSYVKKIIESFNDTRINYIRNDENIGLTKSLNKALHASSGKYIARMDADDISFCNRLELQYKYMEVHKKTVVLGTLAIRTDNNKVVGFIPNSNQEVIKAKLLLDNIDLIHPTAFIRNEVLKENKIVYDEKMKKSQDYGMWVDCIRYGKIESLPTILLKYRIHEKQISMAGKENQLYFNNYIRLKQIDILHIELNKRDKDSFLDIREYQINTSINELYKVLMLIMKMNKKIGYYNSKSLEKELLMHWLIAGKKNNRSQLCKFIWTYKVLIPSNIWYILKEKRINKMKENRINKDNVSINKVIKLVD